jgi:hypothetical protein
MTRELLLVCIGATIVSSGTAYLCWTYLRIVLLRQQLFEIRDAMWDKARERRGFNDPAYREARSRLNSAIHMVHWITLPVIARAIDAPSPNSSFIKSRDLVLQEAIDEAYSAFANRILHHLMRHTICGLLVLVAAKLYTTAKTLRTPFSVLADWFKKNFGRPLEPVTVTCWMGSQQFAELSNAEAWANRSEPREEDMSMQTAS